MSETRLVKCMNCGAVLDYDSYCSSCYLSALDEEHDVGYDEGYKKAIDEVKTIINGLKEIDDELKRFILGKLRTIE